MLRKVKRGIVVMLAKVLCSSLSGRVIRFVFNDRIPSLRFGGPRIRTSVSELSPENIAAIFFGGYESGEIRYIKKYLPTHLDVVELGSSIGVTGAQIARRLSAGRKLVCVEMNPGLICLLEKNVGARDCDVHVCNRAIASAPNRKSHLPFFPDDNTLKSRVCDDLPAGRETEMVERATLGALLADHEIDEFSLICDIEGSEAELLAYEADVLKRCKTMIIELHATVLEGKSLSIEDLATQLKELHGFELKASHGAVYCFFR